MACLSDIEKEIGENVQIWGHIVTRGGKRVTITPSSSPLTWVPEALAVGGEDDRAPPGFSIDTLGAFLPSHDNTDGTQKYNGLVRGVFETIKKAGNNKGNTKCILEPVTFEEASPLWIALVSKVQVRAEGFVCVGSHQA